MPHDLANDGYAALKRAAGDREG